MVRAPNAQRCTIYDLAGGYPPSTYERSRAENKRFDHICLPVRVKIADIKAFEEVDVLRAAMAPAVEADHCQRYILGVVEELERRGIVDRGRAKAQRKDLQMNLFEGPNKPVRESTYKGWVKRFGEEGALEKLMRFQGFL